MTHELPYTAAYGKIGTLFEKIAKAKVPEAFTVNYLSQSLGLKSTNDRTLISLLKKLGFLDSAGKPTSTYPKLKGTNAASAIAAGIRQAYAPLYDANESAHELSTEDLKGLVAQVSGAAESLIAFIVGTFRNLIKSADFSSPVDSVEAALSKKIVNDLEPKKPSVAEDKFVPVEENAPSRREFRPDFKFNIEIHLPSNGTEDTYLAIFNALRKSLG